MRDKKEFRLEFKYFRELSCNIKKFQHTTQAA